jgi:diaminopimelate decarboxylase
MPRVLLSVDADDEALAVARALRAGCPSLHLTAVSRAPYGPAVDADVFDDVWRTPAWAALSPSAHAAAIDERLGPETGYLPSSAAELRGLVDALPAHERLLAPSREALARTEDPDVAAAAALPVETPDRISLSAPVEALHAFGRRHDWRLWMRAPNGERKALDHWTEFDRTRAALAPHVDAPDRLFLQRRVEGPSVTLPFAAHAGTLLGAALVRPAPDRRATSHVDPVPDPLRSALADVLGALNWTGGGTLSLIEEEDGTRWLDDWRPCFDAAAEGVARCGLNLPARLVAAASGTRVDAPNAPTGAFSERTTRVPVRREVDQPPSDSEATASDPPAPSSPLPSSEGSVGLTDDLRAIVDDLPADWATADTPRPLLLRTRTRERFSAFAAAADRVEEALGLGAARVALSLKTNPAPRLVETARAAGMLAETIHPDEMAHARRHGYATGEVVVNGPVQALLPDLDAAPYALFGDAVSDLSDLPFDPSGGIVGVRTRPPERGPSRFGVDLSDADRMDRLCERLAALPASTRLGLHLHAPASTLGPGAWWASLERVLRWARAIQDRTGRPVEALDLGGGWHPDDWLDVFVPGLLARREDIRAALPALDTLLLEPGKALSQPLGIVVSRVLDARPSRNEVILDASLAELSNIDDHPHRLLARTDDSGWHRLPRGDGRLLGRLCMEADVLGRRRQVDHLAPGDTVVVCDAGAYDASMTYPFGRGRSAA